VSLEFTPETIVAFSHRGEYRVHVVLSEGEWRGLAWATFHGYDGNCDSVEQSSVFEPVGAVQAACSAHADAQPAWPAMLGWPALLAVLCLALTSCADAHSRIEGPPLYMHLCDAMPAADQDAWGAAAADVNAELPEPAVWVGHGEPNDCGTIDVCPGEHAETHIGTCVITVRYAPGSAGDVARDELELLLGRL
jgi:hypothetical protein